MRKLYLVLVLLCLIGCNSNITPQDEDLSQLQQVQGQLNFVLLVPTIPDGFQLDRTSIEPDGTVVKLRYLDETRTTEITIIQYTVPQGIVPGIPTGANVRQLKVGDALFPLRINTTLGVTQRALHYQRDKLYIQIITDVLPEAFSDDELAELAASLHPLTP